MTESTDKAGTQKNALRLFSQFVSIAKAVPYDECALCDGTPLDIVKAVFEDYSFVYSPDDFDLDAVPEDAAAGVYANLKQLLWDGYTKIIVGGDSVLQRRFIESVRKFEFDPFQNAAMIMLAPKMRLALIFYAALLLCQQTVDKEARGQCMKNYIQFIKDAFKSGGRATAAPKGDTSVLIPGDIELDCNNHLADGWTYSPLSGLPNLHSSDVQTMPSMAADDESPGAQCDDGGGEQHVKQTVAAKNMLAFMATLDTFPPELFEAAEVEALYNRLSDGAMFQPKDSAKTSRPHYMQCMKPLQTSAPAEPIEFDEVNKHLVYVLDSTPMDTTTRVKLKRNLDARVKRVRDAMAEFKHHERTHYVLSLFERDITKALETISRLCSDSTRKRQASEKQGQPAKKLHRAHSTPAVGAVAPLTPGQSSAHGQQHTLTWARFKEEIRSFVASLDDADKAVVCNVCTRSSWEFPLFKDSLLAAVKEGMMDDTAVYTPMITSMFAADVDAVMQSYEQIHMLGTITNSSGLVRCVAGMQVATLLGWTNFPVDKIVQHISTLISMALNRGISDLQSEDCAEWDSTPTRLCDWTKFVRVSERCAQTIARSGQQPAKSCDFDYASLFVCVALCVAQQARVKSCNWTEFFNLM